MIKDRDIIQRNNFCDFSDLSKEDSEEITRIQNDILKTYVSFDSKVDLMAFLSTLVFLNNIKKE